MSFPNSISLSLLLVVVSWVSVPTLPVPDDWTAAVLLFRCISELFWSVIEPALVVPPMSNYPARSLETCLRLIGYFSCLLWLLAAELLIKDGIAEPDVAVIDDVGGFDFLAV